MDGLQVVFNPPGHLINISEECLVLNGSSTSFGN